MRTQIFSIVIILSLVGCEDEDDYGLSMEDRDIMEKAYSETYTYPDGFYFEENLDGSVYYENTVSIRTSESSWIELHTNDKQQAKEWSETASNECLLS